VTLAETQALFWRALQGEDVDVDSCFVGDALSAQERVEIYVDMYVERLVDVLEQDFPETREAMGHDRFGRIARDYLKANPSQDPDVGRVGRGFAEFVPVEHRALAAKEWARAEVFVEREVAPLTPEQFQAAIDPTRFGAQRLQLVPALRLVGETAVWRASPTLIHDVELDTQEARALRLALHGAPVEQVCGAFAEASDAFEALQGWVAEGWIAGLMSAA
jgi:hypothetical protein